MTPAGPLLAGCVVPVPARAGVALPGGETGAELLARFPSRPAVASWPATLATRQQVLRRLLAPPFALDNPASQQGRRLGLVTVVNWLEAQPGDSWQDRWLGSGAETRGDWRELITAWKAGRAGTPPRGLAEARASCRRRAAGADRRRRDPPGHRLAAQVPVGAPQPGRRDGPYPGWEGFRRAGRVVPVRIDGIVWPAGRARQDRGHHRGQGRCRRRDHCRGLRAVAGDRRPDAHRGRPAFQQPVLLPAAACLGRVRPRTRRRRCGCSPAAGSRRASS